MWTSIVTEAKSIVKQMERQKEINFGYSDDNSQIGLIQFPNPEQNPFISLNDYNPQDMKSWNSRDVRNYVSSSISGKPTHNQSTQMIL